MKKQQKLNNGSWKSHSKINFILRMSAAVGHFRFISLNFPSQGLQPLKTALEYFAAPLYSIFSLSSNVQPLHCCQYGLSPTLHRWWKTEFDFFYDPFYLQKTAKLCYKIGVCGYNESKERIGSMFLPSPWWVFWRIFLVELLFKCEAKCVLDLFQKGI